MGPRFRDTGPSNLDFHYGPLWGRIGLRELWKVPQITVESFGVSWRRVVRPDAVFEKRATARWRHQSSALVNGFSALRALGLFFW